MNRHFLIITLFILLSSCIGKHNSDAQKATISEKSTEVESETIGDTIRIDLSKSNIHWKGTKMRGAGKHEGEIELQSSFLIKNNNQLVNGSFVADMTTIGVTDIPEHEPVPRDNLNNHLKSSDFFDVEKFPTSAFEITKVKQVSSDSLLISGNLTLKDVTKNIEFGAKYQDKIFTTKFTFDRFQWNITYEGNFADKTLVDKDVELTIRLETE
ncbi:MAG: YceI family protein [Reichenbachiella sp.]|uniref:YceI family protein n=1 Tax=Reichenbachiella sp. TaxID=2184521 RepID=UPI0029676551|nr:YceI family protein [Reichenbachiella sp.]MDW3209111.1 YceI family protein [Reichenbachiella sp.]